MAATKYLDYDGLLYFWSLIKAKLALKADAQSVTAGSYGPSADASPAHSGTFKVPYVQVTSQGVVTAISEKTITLPASGNTDTKVKQNLKATSDTGKYPVLLKNSTTATDNPTGEANYAAAITVQPSTGTVEATTFKGAVTGKATSAAKLDPGASINGTAFTGESDITTSKWGTARNISISDSDGTNTGTAVSVDGSAAKTLKLPSIIKASLTGNASTADQVNHDLVIKIKTGTTEGTNLYTFNGSADKTLDIKQGSNVTLTAAANTLTIASTNTKNTAGSTDTSSKIYLIGATTQDTNPQTYSQDTAYVGTDGCLYSNNLKVATAATTLSGYGITDAYTKTEIDSKLTSAMHYKGSVAAVANLPTSNNAVGDFYNVTATGENYAWTGSEWDVTGSIVDLQSITNAEIDTVVAS